MEKSVLIIGSGPAGLGMAGRLKKAGIPFHVIEKSEEVAHSWVNHYDRLHLHTVNQFSSLPHMEFPADFPTFVSKQNLVDYLKSYAREFDIQPDFGQEVKDISSVDGGWLVKTDNKSYHHEKVVVATGVNRVPIVPEWPGTDKFAGEIIHSRKYKNPDPFEGKCVLVVGMGNTGAEIALDLCEKGVQTFLSVRSPVNIVPLKVLGNPTQKTALKLNKLPNWLADRIAITMQRLTIGRMDKYGIPTPTMAPSAQLRETGKTPVIDLGTAKRIKKGDIRVVPGIKEFHEKYLLMDDGARVYADAVILCTGYKALLEDFVPGIEPHLDQYGNPTSAIGTDKLNGLYFLGFDNFRPGGILGAIRLDSKAILDHLQSVN